MSNTNLGTLNTISYNNLQQFIDDVNRNFAVVQNSPLFKGIPGNEAEPGDEGPQGIRGSKFIFIDFVKFQSIFSNEINTSTQIDLVYLNSKLSDNDNKNLLLTALGVSFLVDGDVIVLTNSLLLNYNFTENKFYDTKKSLSQSVTTDIENIIRQMFNGYLPILQSGIKNVFENYQTLAKNYSDNNNTGITNSLNSTSVYSPFIEGVTNNVGIAIPNHKHYGISTDLNTESSQNTLVLGNIIKYYKLLMNTVSTDGTQTLNSNYAPGVNNIPAAVLLQDTYNNGLMLGYKDKSNLKSFGSIYKNEANELVIKSDSGNLPVDFSSLKLHKNYLRYDKTAQFNDSLEVSHNLFVGGHYNSKFLSTGFNTNSVDPTIFGDTYNSKNYVAIGSKDVLQSILQLRGEKINLPSHKLKALVTDSNGNLDTHVVENTFITESISSSYVQPSEITTGVSTKRVLTTYYYNYLVRKMNQMFNGYLNGLYWTKSEFNSNVIPQLRLSDNFSVENNASLAGVANFNRSFSRISLLAETLNIESEGITFKKYPNQFLIADGNGLLRHDVNLMTYIPTANEVYIPGQDYKILTDRHLAHLLNIINNNTISVNNNFWTKPQFLNFEIPNLTLNTGLFSKKYLAVNKSLNANAIFTEFLTHNDTLFLVNTENNSIKLGDNNGMSEINIRGNVNLLGLNQTGLSTDSRGKIISTPFLGVINQSNFTITQANNYMLQTSRMLPDHKTVGSIMLAIINQHDNLKSYIDTQISNLSSSFTTQLSQLSNQINQQITIINSDLTNIHNILNTKANTSYVDGIANVITNNINNMQNVINQHQIDIDWIKSQLLIKVNQADFNNLVNDFNDFKSKIPKIPKGIICLWEGVINNIGQVTASIPEDWEEVISMRGRVAVGWLNGQSGNEFLGEGGLNLFDTLGNSGGYATHSLTSNQNGPHTHPWYGLSGRSMSAAQGSLRNSIEDANHNTSSSGLGTPHNNTQPYRVVVYIKSLKGWTINAGGSGASTPPAPTANTPQTFSTAQTVTVNDLTANGQNLKWYINNTTTTPLNSVSPLTTNTTYYVSQTISGVESTRTAVNVVINVPTVVPAPTGDTLYYGIFGDKVLDIIAFIDGQGLKCYSSPTSMILIHTSTNLNNNTTYYFTQTVNGVESQNRLGVTTILS